MGKKSRSSGSTNDGTPDDAQSPARNHHSDANKSAPLPTEESTPAQEGPGWIRFKRSFIGMMFLAGLAMTDVQGLKEGFTVAVPDNKPLLSIVILFAWYIWRRWDRSGRIGLHPIIRALGFMVVLAAATSLLPFNSKVTMYEVPFFTPEECHTVAEAAAVATAFPGFVPVRSCFDPETEVPLEDLSLEVALCN